MGTITGQWGASCALALNIFLCLCNALPSVPIATDPVVATVTVPTVVPSLVTVYSIVPATDATPNAVTTITTTIDGHTTTIISTGVIAGSITSTIVSTVSFTTSQVVVSTVGYSTIFGPDPTPTTTASSISPTTATSTSDIPSSTATSALEAPPTSSSVEETSALTTSSAASITSASTASLTSSSAAAGTNAPSQASHSSSPSKGLSTGAKAGIGIGVAIGVIMLVILSFLLGQRYSRRRNKLAKANTDLTGTEEKDIFQAGRPYETTRGRKHDSLGLSAAGGHVSSMNTAVMKSGSESVSGESYDIPAPNSPNNIVNNPELSALPPIEKGDEPMYVGVPAHMSGSKRWSMKEFMK